ncbi:MAG TPA: hypothetical protein ENI87_15630 [bacterium]|nr:hypothetical protein [bacterium]
MQRFRSLFVPAVLTTWMLSASGPLAQEPTPLTVIEAGTVHPVSAPPIEDGIVVVRGERILAVGKQGDLQFPPDTTVHRFPTGHVYPGLIDAQTDAFTDATLQRDTSLNGASLIKDGLVWSDARDDHLVEHGITTAYVTVRTGAQVRGQGCIVRPLRTGFEPWPGHEQAALELRMTSGRGSSHPLARQQQFAGIARLFDNLEQYRESREKYQEALEKYRKDFAAYLEHHRKKNGKEAPASGGAAGAQREGESQPAAAQPQATAATKKGEKAEDGKAKKGDGPKRPTFPKKVKVDDQKEALLKVLDGELPLRVEAHRPDELRAALQMQVDKEIPLLVLEQAYGADRLAERIARQGASVVLTDVLPHSLGAPGDRRNPYAKFDPTALPRILDEAGVPFAIASGDARLSPLLPMMAAAAIGRGLSPAAALRAITLTPAEILGIADDTGSLQRGKFADLLVTDGPLFASDSKLLLVIARGRTQHQAQSQTTKPK